MAIIVLWCNGWVIGMIISLAIIVHHAWVFHMEMAMILWMSNSDNYDNSAFMDE